MFIQMVVLIGFTDDITHTKPSGTDPDTNKLQVGPQTLACKAQTHFRKMRYWVGTQSGKTEVERKVTLRNNSDSIDTF